MQTNKEINDNQLFNNDIHAYHVEYKKDKNSLNIPCILEITNGKIKIVAIENNLQIKEISFNDVIGSKIKSYEFIINSESKGISSDKKEIAIVYYPLVTLKGSCICCRCQSSKCCKTQTKRLIKVNK